jgi:CRP-like cAMP-binding protein
MMTPIEILKQSPLFNSLENADLEGLVSSMRVQSLKQGQTLFYKGDEGTALYIIKRGAIKIVLPSKIGDEIIVTIFTVNDFFGEMALLDGEPRSANAVAIEPTEVFVLNRNNFLSFLKSNINAIRSILSSLSKRLRLTDEFLEDTCFLSISARLAKKLVELAESHGKKEENIVNIDLNLTQKELGDMIGATRESTNKELKMLRDRGLISTDGYRIKIHDMVRLKRRIK